MDSFVFKRPRISDDNPTPTPGPSSSTQNPVFEANASLDTSSNTTHSLDIGLYLDDNNQIDEDLRLKLLTRPWTPKKDYNFKTDVNPGAKAFRHAWLTNYAWLAYSAKVKGPLCKICVLFRSPEQHGLKEFTNSPCRKYQRFNEVAKSHEKSKKHIDAENSSNSFKNTMETKAREFKNNALEEYRVKLRSAVSTILFCGMRDLPLCGKVCEGSLFTDLQHFRDNSAAENLSTSDQIQKQLKQLIQTCSDVLKSEIVEEVNRASVFSVLVDETTDINGKEQLSIGVRYLRCDNAKNPIICEEFLGYVPIEQLESESIADTIIKFLQNCKFDLNKLVGQGYDGCTTMAGYIHDVKNIINDNDKLPALLFHCASQILNHVVNDLNDVGEVRFTAETTKNIVHFLKENTQHIRDLRNEISDIRLFYETETYESIRIFSENFYTIVQSLEEVALNALNPKAKTKAHQLYTIARTPTYIVTMLVIATYSAKLEPTCKKLQEEYLDINATCNYIKELTHILKSHLNYPSKEFAEIYEKAHELFEKLNVDFTLPLVVAGQVGDSNKFENPEEFYKESVFLPYLDSIISFLNNRFSYIHNTGFSLMLLHPKNMRELDKYSFLIIAEDIQRFYGELLDNFVAEATTWYEYWKTFEAADESIVFADLVGKATQYYPSVRKAIEICLTLPATTSYEHTFSTLRHVKMWHRATMGHTRLNGLCMLSVHRIRVEKDAHFIDKVIKKYEQRPKVCSIFNQTLN